MLASVYIGLFNPHHMTAYHHCECIQYKWLNPENLLCAKTISHALLCQLIHTVAYTWVISIWKREETFNSSNLVGSEARTEKHQDVAVSISSKQTELCAFCTAQGVKTLYMGDAVTPGCRLLEGKEMPRNSNVIREASRLLWWLWNFISNTL